MAFIPDDAMRRKREISRSAWDVYEALCKFADKETGIVEERYLHQWHPYKRHARLVEWSGLTLGSAKNALTELRKKRWIAEDNGHIFLLVGTFLDKLRKPKKSAPSPVVSSDPPSPYNDDSSPTNDDSSFTNDGAYIDRARDSYQTNQTDQNHMSAVDVESSARAREPDQQQQHQTLSDENSSIVDEEFLDRLQAARKYQQRGVDVRAVLEILCIKTGLAPEQVPRARLMAWCDRERVIPTDGGNDNGTNGQRAQTTYVSAAERRDRILRERDYEGNARRAVEELERFGRGF
jgi:hypothetical protein